MSETETEERQEAAAELTPAKEDAAATVAQAFMDDFTGAPNSNVEDTAPALEPEPAAEVPVPVEFSPEIPDDLLRELDEAEIDEQVEQELANRETEEDEYGVVEDEETVRERVRLEKRNAYLEKELAKSKEGAWRDEAVRYFPLSKHKLSEIADKATSRRSFLRQAKAEHEAILPHVQEYLALAKTVVDQETAAARTAGKQAAAAAYGAPLSGPDVNEIDQAAANSAIAAAREEARKTGNLAGLFRKMIEVGK
jgi:hypothetical protein